jgi:hypothetical protein
MMKMDATTYRKLNLRYLCAKSSRQDVAHKSGKSIAQINQLLGRINGNNGRFGTVIARDLERSLDLQYGWLDAPHPELWDADSGAAAIGLIEDDAASYIPSLIDEETELLKVFRSLPKSGRLAVLSCAYAEHEKGN